METSTWEPLDEPGRISNRWLDSFGKRMNLKTMRLFLDIRLGIKNLLLHKLRSFLTMLGVVFGVASVVAMLSVGEGASVQALEQIRKLGSNNIIISAVKPTDAVSTSNQRSFMSIYGLTYDDLDRVQSGLDTVKRAVPVKVVRREGRLRERAMELRIVGTTPDWFSLVQRPLVAGRVILPQDEEESANVVVLTEFGARKILAGENTLGQTLSIGSNTYKIVGIIQSEQSQAGGIQTPDQEVDAYIPIRVARERYGM
ncbi:MAG: ABC transporter permease [Phycisphaerales bacterium]|nr:ABC transporter permease [Phycisphaerales bacterium]